MEHLDSPSRGDCGLVGGEKDLNSQRNLILR